MTTMTAEQQAEMSLALGMPKGWTYSVRGTKNTIQITARRPNNEGTYKLTADRRNPQPEVYEFVRMCQLFAGDFA